MPPARRAPHPAPRAWPDAKSDPPRYESGGDAGGGGLFQLEYVPVVWPFLATALLSAGLCVYALRGQPRLPAVATFAWLAAALTLWTGSYALELSSATLAGKRFWAAAKYLGSAPGPVLWLVLALRLTGSRRIGRPLALVLAAFAAVTVLVVFTNPLHHWFWTTVRHVPGRPETQVEHGFYFGFYAAGLYVLMLASVALFARHALRTPGYDRTQAALLVLAGLVPLAGRVLESFFGIELVRGVDNVVLLLLVSVVLLALAIFRFGTLGIRHVAHDLVVRNIRAGILVVDPGLRVVEMNPCAGEILGRAAERTIGLPLGEVLGGWPELRVDEAAEQEVHVVEGGSARWFRVQSSPIPARAGGRIGWAVVLFDVTEHKQAEHRLEDLARTDALTGITNRRHFFELAELEHARARRYGRPLTVLMFDIDHFKQVNDRWGHRAGDETLRFVAARCQQHLRKTDLFARYGGEEFVCLLAEGDLASAQYTAERLREMIEESPLRLDGHAIRVTVSMGLAHARAGESFTLEELIERADRALYASKEAGRNRVTLATTA